MSEARITYTAIEAIVSAPSPARVSYFGLEIVTSPPRSELSALTVQFDEGVLANLGST